MHFSSSSIIQIDGFNTFSAQIPWSTCGLEVLRQFLKDFTWKKFVSNVKPQSEVPSPLIVFDHKEISFIYKKNSFNISNWVTLEKICSVVGFFGLYFSVPLFSYKWHFGSAVHLVTWVFHWVIHGNSPASWERIPLLCK